MTPRTDCPRCLKGMPCGCPPVFVDRTERAPTILDLADEATRGDRQRDYGHPSDNHGRTAMLWTHYLGIPVTADDVCMLNILQKVSRARHKLTRDTLVDVAGYARNAEMIHDTRGDPL